MKGSRAFGQKTGLFIAAAILVLVLPAGARAGTPRSGEAVFQGGEWKETSPAAAGFDGKKLEDFARFVGGAGCVVRRGSMVSAWGNYKDRADVASAFKPFYGHLAYKAVEKGIIAGLDSPVSLQVPGLRELNASLDYKDRLITWRHLLSQTSCYGMSEKPGTAFDYSDYQTALFVDTLVYRVYGSDYSRVDGEVLEPVLTGPLGCQDKPTIAGGAKTHNGRLRISARDLARFGLLYLGGGSIGGTRILDPVFAELAVSTPLDSSLPRTGRVTADMLPGQRSIGGGADMEDHLGCYSNFWWLNRETPDGRPLFPAAPTDTFAALGQGGAHALIVIPSLDVVVSWVVGLQDRKARNISFEGRRAVNEALGLLIDALRPKSGAGPGTPSGSRAR